MTQILIWLQGKKSTIGAILALVNTFLLTKGIIDNDWAILINGILLALGLTANIATARLVK